MRGFKQGGWLPVCLGVLLLAGCAAPRGESQRPGPVIDGSSAPDAVTISQFSAVLRELTLRNDGRAIEPSAPLGYKDSDTTWFVRLLSSTATSVTVDVGTLYAGRRAAEEAAIDGVELLDPGYGRNTSQQPQTLRFADSSIILLLDDEGESGSYRSVGTQELRQALAAGLAGTQVGFLMMLEDERVAVLVEVDGP